MAALALLVSSAPALRAQQGAPIHGVVADESTWRPVPFARVTLVEAQAETLTAQNGTFVFTNPPLGRVSIRVEAPGFPTVLEELEVAADVPLFVQFILPEIRAVLDEILVPGRADRPAEPRTAADLLAMEVRGVLGNTGSVGSDDSAILLRGVSSIVLQGDPVVYVDGVRLGGGPGEAFLALTQIPASDVRDIRVLRGPTGSFLSGSANGVIEVWTKSGVEQR